MNKLSIIFIMLLVLSSVGFALTGTINSFSGQTNPFNITFTGNQNYTYYLDVPRYGYVGNVSLNINSTLEYCYQETANIASTCGGLATGNYSTKKDYFYVNYTIPSFASNYSLWQVKHGNAGTVYNVSIPKNCFNKVNNKLELGFISNQDEIYGGGAGGGFSVGICFDGTTWLNFTNVFSGVFSGTGGSGSCSPEKLYDGDWSNKVSWIDGAPTCWVEKNTCDADIYEEAMFWKVNSTNQVIYINNLIVSNITNKIVNSLNITLINSILQSSCTCTNCTISGSNCRIPHTFHSDTAGILSVNLSIANYSYGISTCSDTSFGFNNNASAINFTGLYEGNNSFANVSITTGSYLTWNLKGLSTTSTFYPIVDGIRNLQYCVYPSWSQYDLTYAVNYQQTGTTTTRQRSGTGLTISSALTTIPLYVLSSSTSINIILTVTDTFSNPIGGVNVIVNRNIAGIDYVIQTAVTGDDGVVSLLMDSTQSYSVTASKVGYTSSTKTINSPSTAGIYTMQLGTESTTQVSNGAGITYQFSPTTSILSNGTTYEFDFNLSSTYWQITACTLTLSNSSGDILSAIGGTFNSSNCNAAINLNTGNQTNIISAAAYTINGTTLVVSQTYQVTSYQQGEYSFQTVLDDLANFSGSGFGWQSRMFLAFVIIFAITALVSIKFGSLINPEQNLILQCALVLFFSFAGWLTIPNGMLTFPTVWGALDAGQYAIFILDLLITGGYIAWRHS